MNQAADQSAAKNNDNSIYFQFLAHGLTPEMVVVDKLVVIYNSSGKQMNFYNVSG